MTAVVVLPYATNVIYFAFAADNKLYGGISTFK